jgi:hypothetical protein
VTGFVILTELKLEVAVFCTGSLPLRIGSATNKLCGRFEVFTAVTMKNGVFWVVTPCGSCKNRRF